MFEAYFDESERDSGAFCVAGCLFTSLEAKRFSKQWRRALSGRIFHAADFFARRRAFADFTQAGVDLLLRRLVGIIRRRTSLLVVVSCNLKDVEALNPKNTTPRKVAYMAAQHFCMGHVGQWVKKRSRGNRVAYIFDQGHEGMPAAKRLIESYARFPAFRDLHHYRSHEFLQSFDSAPLQAADLFAWECGKLLAETVETNKRSVRQSMRALAGDPTRHRVFDHFDGSRLRQTIEMFDHSWPTSRK